MDLLKRALAVGALEVRLVPGRRTIVVLPQGENEVKGDPQTPERITEFIGPVMTAEARRALASGWAEWDFQLDGYGTIRTCAELKLGLPHVSLFLDRCEPPQASSRSGSMQRPSGAHRQPSIPEVVPPSDPRDGRPVLPTVPPLSPSAQVYDAGMSGGSTTEIDRLLLEMLKLKASDLHVTAGTVPMVRVDGEMRAIEGLTALSPEAVQRAIFPIVPPRNREEFARTHDTDFAYELLGRARFRANLFVDMRGMGAVFRVIPSRILTAEELSLPKEVLSLCHLPKGLVLVTGPTGSGKSTTLAALIDYINRTRSDHVITIEDPVEFVHQNKRCLINQRQVGEHTDSFKRALRAALREDPDIVLLGEMRDLETVSIALETAETG
ncbi:MAG TPA: ATPase, T2SS/T4P/T4SS family, partial [Polyangiaceae bacterium]|nr:ATPase, T2SS/T4P/T4SS family [Polyangiaceae bacterium]